MANATSTQLQELYVAYFGRAADPTGLDYWTEKGITQASFAADMYAQNEFKSAYGDKSTEAQVNQIYKNLFDREADVTGLTYWTQQINLGVLKVAEIATHLIWAAQNNEGSETDKTALENRTAAAIAYTAEVKLTTAGILAYQAQSTDPWVSGSNIAEAVSYLSGIDATTAHTAAGVTASVTTITGNGDPTGVGSTFVLTTNTDSAGTTSAANGTITSSFRFTDSGNEVVTADIGTLQAADVLLDGSSTDSDVMNITANAALGEFTANRIEKFTVDMAAGSPSLDVTNLTNFTNIDVKGTVAGSVLDIDAQQKQPTIKLDGYTRVLTADVDTLAGTTTAATAETMNFEVSGTTYGSSASTRSGITITTAITGTLETLNITSVGTAANEFTLDADTTGANVVLDTVNFLGATDLTTRVDATDVHGITLVAGSATGTQTLKLDKTGDSTATNTTLFTGFDNFIVIDSASPAVTGDVASLSGLASGQKITLADDFNATTLSFRSVSGSSDTATLVLDNESSSTDVDVASVDIQNVESVTITSSGKAGTSTSTAANVNLIDSFTGDATTITINGDTALDLDLAIDKASSGSAGSRAVTVDASTSTGAVTIETAASTGTGSVSYTITGTDNADTITLANATNAGTINAGSGNDTITSGNGNDTIDLGAGTNLFYGSTGTDAVTLGAGANTLRFGEYDVAAVAQVQTLTPSGWDSGVISVKIDGREYQTAYATNVSNSIDNFITANAADILADTGMTATDGTTTIILTGNADGTSYNVSFTNQDGNVIIGSTGTATTAAVSGVTVQTAVTGFKTGSTDDIISFDLSELNAIVGDVSDSAGNVGSTDDVVVHTHTTGTTDAASDVDNGTNVIKFAYANTLNAFSDIATALDSTPITVDSELGATDVIASVYYDADAGNAVFGFVINGNPTAANILDDNVTFNEIATAAMSITEYNAIGASNFTFVA